MGNGKNKAENRRRYPGHRPCNNHELLDEMLKDPIPEMCPKCFAGIAQHQVQLVANNYCRTFILINKVSDLIETIASLQARIDELDERVAP